MFNDKIIDPHSCLQTIILSCRARGGMLNDQVVLLLILSSQSKLSIFSNMVFRLLEVAESFKIINRCGV